MYTLTDAAWSLLDEGRERIFHRAPGPWDGQWHMVIYSVPESERGLREQLRKKLAWLGFGALSASVWLSPHERAGLLKDAFADEPAVRLDVFRSRSAGLAASQLRKRIANSQPADPFSRIWTWTISAGSHPP